MVGYVRRNFLVPMPSFESFDALNALAGAALPGAEGCQAPGTFAETIGQRMERDLDALLPSTASSLRRLRQSRPDRVSSLSLGQISGPTTTRCR